MRKNLERYFAERREKKKTGNIRVTYEELLEQAAGNEERKLLEIRTGRVREFQQLLEVFVQEGVLSPVKRSKKPGYLATVYERYEIVGNKEKVVEDPEYLALLHSYVGTKVLEFYKRNRRAFEQDREAIDILYNYYCRVEKVWMTANELGYYLFGDEKAFEQPEGEKEKQASDEQEMSTEKDGGGRHRKKAGAYTHLLNRMGFDIETDLHAFYTKEPFICQVRPSFFEKNIRKILIVENKDTYFRIKNGIYGKEYDCVIYGEGWKIIRAFSLAEETGIMETDTIEYFGDIDPEGFAIYYELKTQYASYSIRLKVEFYEKILEAVRGSERKPGKIRGKIQNRAREVLPSALQEFDTETADFLQRMMLKDLCYIPQEALILVGEAEVENTTRRIRSNGVT